MATILKIAWRNLWRNRRRTLITVASVFFGVLLSAYMTSMQEGKNDKMIDLVVKFYSGYIQVHHRDYRKNKNINNSYIYNDSLIHELTKHPEVNQVFPRLESFSLVSSGNLTKGAFVSGIVPGKEDQWTNLSSKIRQGNYLKEGDDGALIGESLSKYLKVKAGDTLIMISQGYQGISAAGKFPLRGIIKHASPELDKSIVYLDINTCQDFFSSPGRCTSLVVNVDHPRVVNQLLGKLRKEIGDSLHVMSWEEMNPSVLQHMESDRAGNVLLKFVLYLVIGFGILAVLMMMITERKKEMGVMVSVGMQKTKLALVLLSETFFIGLLGVAAGLIAGIPLIFFQAAHPIPLTGKTGRMLQDFGFEPFLYFSTSLEVFLYQVVTIFVITLLVSAYPVTVALKFDVIQSVRK